MSRTKVAFLYTEIAGYFLACVEELSKNADVLVVRWPVNKEAPFAFSQTDKVELVDRNSLSDENLLKKVKLFNPDILVSSGWIDKGYLKVAASFKKKIPVIVSLDNHWKGSLRQRLAVMTSSLYLRKIFTHAWVPGTPQKQFAEKLGFGKNILQNFYSAAKQSGQTHFPELDELKSFGQFIKETEKYDLLKLIAHCDNDDEKVTFNNLLKTKQDILILIGPEGDFSKEEIILAKENKFIPVSLGNSRLRTETAGIVACANLRYILSY